MSDSPPAWLDNAPPPDAYDQGGGRAAQQRGGGNRRPPAMTADEAAAAAEDFYAWLAATETRVQLGLVLPDHVDPDVFIATAKTAVLNKPDLLRIDLRPSLLLAVQKAAAQGLLPDGKQGALVPRYDTEARQYRVAWQPMVWGIVKLGRETGAIRSIRAAIVFHGEPFRIIQGDEDRIEHEIVPDVVDEAYGALNGGRDAHSNPVAKPDEFFARVRAAYCIITGTDGIPTKRWMTKQRLISLWESSRAANGPWKSRWIDEMILKAVILFTAKWINLDPSGAPAKRFQAALMTDMEIDFDRERERPEAQPAPPQQAALPAPEMKLGTLEDMLGGEKEKVPVGTGEGAAAVAFPQQKLAPADDAASTQGRGERRAPSSPAAGGGAASSADPIDETTPAGPPPADVQDAGGGGGISSPPASDPLAERVDTALGEIARRSLEAVTKMVGGKSYKAFIAELTAAGRSDLVGLLAKAVEAKAAGLRVDTMLAAVRAEKTVAGLGALEKNDAFMADFKAAHPDDQARIRAAIEQCYSDL
jgi:recombinational DNA repair protein RecT